MSEVLRSAHESNPFASLERTWSAAVPISEIRDVDSPSESAFEIFKSFGIGQNSSIVEDFVSLGSCKISALELFRFSMGRSYLDLTETVLPPLEPALLWVLNGKAQIDFPTSQIEVAPGDIAVIRSWQKHHVTVSENVELIFMKAPIEWFCADGYGDSIDWLADATVIRSKFVFHNSLSAAFEAFLKSGNKTRDLKAADSLLRFTIRLAFAAAYIKSMNTYPLKSGRIRTIFDRVATVFADPELTPKQIADDLRISVRTLHQACADFGTTFSQLLSMIRLHNASFRLTYSSERISGIAYSVGYESLSHFCRQFKEKFGVTPREYRKRH